MSKTLSEDSEGKRASANEFGTRQLFRRPAPTSTGGAEIGHAYIQWNQGTVSIPANTWSNLDPIAAADFGEGFESTPNPFSFAVDLGQGTASIGWDGSSFDQPVVLVYAWAEWSSNTFADGDEIGVGIRTGHDGTFSQLYINTVPIGGDPSDIQNRRVTTAIVLGGSDNQNGAKVNVWQSSGGAKSCGNVHLSVTGLMAWAGTFYP